MAGNGWKAWTRERLTVDDVQGYLQDQTVLAFDSAAQRTAELTVPEAGMVSYLRDSDALAARTPSAAGASVGGAWRGIARSWGTVAIPSSPVAGDWTTAQPGDTAYVSTWRCNAIVSGLTAPAWKQVDIPSIGTVAGRDTFAADAVTAGAPLPAGFLVYVTANERIYQRNSAAGWRLVGGAAGAALTLTTGTGAPQTGWGAHAGSLQHHGNGMATVQFDITRSGADVVPSTTGKITNSPLLQLPGGWEARTGSAIGPAAGGNRSAFGYIAQSSGVVTLTGVTGTANIATGAVISLSGTYPLAAPQDLTP